MEELSLTIFINNDVNFFLQKIQQKKTETLLVTINNGGVQQILRFDGRIFTKVSWIDPSVYRKVIKNIQVYQDDSINYFVDV